MKNVKIASSEALKMCPGSIVANTGEIMDVNVKSGGKVTNDPPSQENDGLHRLECKEQCLVAESVDPPESVKTAVCSENEASFNSTTSSFMENE